MNQGSHVNTLTVAEGKVREARPGFVLFVRMAHLSDAWWDATSDDLGNIRAKERGAIVPFDVMLYDRAAKTGHLFIKTTLSPKGITLTIEAIGGARPLEPDDPNGRNEVWSDPDDRMFARHFLGDEIPAGHPAWLP